MKNLKKLIAYLKAGNHIVLNQIKQKDFTAMVDIILIVMNGLIGFQQFQEGFMLSFANALLQMAICYSIFVLVNTGFLIFMNRK